MNQTYYSSIFQLVVFCCINFTFIRFIGCWYVVVSVVRLIEQYLKENNLMKTLIVLQVTLLFQAFFTTYLSPIWLRSGFSIANQIKFDLRFTDLQLTWCSELIVDKPCFVFPYIFDLQLRDRQLADLLSAEPTLCQSHWLTVTSICGVALRCLWWRFTIWPYVL